MPRTWTVSLAGLLLLPSLLWAQEGVEVEVAYTADLLRTVHGGATVEGAALHNLDATLTLDGSSLGWEGGSLFLYGLANWGGSASDHVGDLQGVSNIEAPEAVRLYEAWVQQELAGGRLSLLMGLFDLNSEFYVTEHAGTLLNSSWGIGPEYALTGDGGPSIFPLTSLAFRAAYHATDRLTLRAAVLDGHPGDPSDPDAPRIRLDREEGALLHGEAEMRFGAEGDAVLRVGGWSYTADFPTLSPSATDPRGRSRGGYLIAEGPLVRGDRPVWGFGRLGAADDRVTRLGWSWAAGLSWEGPLAGRPGDELALGVVGTVDGDPYVRAASPEMVPSNELAVELTWRFALGGWGAIQPDVQYILDPGLTPDGDDALVVGVRAFLALRAF